MFKRLAILLFLGFFLFFSIEHIQATKRKRISSCQASKKGKTDEAKITEPWIHPILKDIISLLNEKKREEMQKELNECLDSVSQQDYKTAVIEFAPGQNDSYSSFDAVFKPIIFLIAQKLGKEPVPVFSIVLSSRDECAAHVHLNEIRLGYGVVEFFLLKVSSVDDQYKKFKALIWVIGHEFGHLCQPVEKADSLVEKILFQKAKKALDHRKLEIRCDLIGAHLSYHFFSDFSAQDFYCGLVNPIPESIEQEMISLDEGIKATKASLAQRNPLESRLSLVFSLVKQYKKKIDCQAYMQGSITNFYIGDEIVSFFSQESHPTAKVRLHHVEQYLGTKTCDRQNGCSIIKD